MPLVAISPNERIQIALRQCYADASDVTALWGLCQDEPDSLTATALLRAMQAACKRRAVAGDKLVAAVLDAQDPRRVPPRSERAYGWRHEEWNPDA